jgi:hypothetical protein
MRYLKNNGEPRAMVVSIQKLIRYWDVDGNEIGIRVIMWRHTGGKTYNEAEPNREARARFLPENKKIFIYEKGGRKFDEKTVDIGYSERIMSYPHIIDIPCGLNVDDERRYTIKVDEIVAIENPEDTENLLKIYHFLDEVDKDGEPIDTEHILTGTPVKGNPYRPLPSKRVDRYLAPTRFEEMGEEAAPRANPIDQRVKEFLPMDETKENKTLMEE